MANPSILNSLERKFILLVGDTLIILASLNLLVNHAIDEKYISLKLKFSVFAIGITAYLVLAYILDFYNLEKVSKRRYFLPQSVYISSLYVFVVFISCVIFYDISFWRGPLLIFLLLTPVEIGLWRLFFSNVFKIIPVTKNVIYIYEDATYDSLRQDMAAINGNDINTKSYNNLPKELEKIILRSMLRGKEVISFTSFYENTYEALPIKSHNDSFYEILQFKNKKIRYLIKIFNFLINFSLALFVGIIFALVTPFVFILNLLFNRGPLFYTQKRVGQHGKEFSIYKFRSMVVDAEKTGAKMATKNDARITPFGRILRLFRIDELPQIISVITGDMQFIGPRPERKIFVKQLNEITPFYNIRHLIKPGITGWAQVKYKYGENLDDSIKKLEYDLYYIKNKSVTLDLRIIFKTVTTVLFSRGV